MQGDASFEELTLRMSNIDLLTQIAQSQSRRPTFGRPRAHSDTELPVFDLHPIVAQRYNSVAEVEHEVDEAIRRHSSRIPEPIEDPNVFHDKDFAILELIVSNGHAVINIHVDESESAVAPSSLSFVKLDDMPVSAIFTTRSGELLLDSMVFLDDKGDLAEKGIPKKLAEKLESDPLIIKAKERHRKRAETAAVKQNPVILHRANSKLVRRVTRETVDVSLKRLDEKVQVPDDPNVFHTPDFSIMKLMDKRGMSFRDVAVLEHDSQLSPVSASFVAMSREFDDDRTPKFVHKLLSEL